MVVPGKVVELEDDKLTAPESPCDSFRRLNDERKVGLVMAAEWRRHANHDDIALFEARKIGGRLKQSFGANNHNRGVQNVFERTSAVVEPIDLRDVSVETDNMKITLGGRKHEWQADVTHTDDADQCLPAFDPLEQRFVDV